MKIVTHFDHEEEIYAWLEDNGFKEELSDNIDTDWVNPDGRRARIDLDDNSLTIEE